MNVQERASDAVRLLGGGDDALHILQTVLNTPREDARIVALVVKKYVQRSAWAAAISSDLQQEAHAAIAKARSTGRFDAEKGDWGGYAYRAAWLALASYLVADSSPVTRREKGAPNAGRRTGIPSPTKRSDAPSGEFCPEDLSGFIEPRRPEDDYAEEEWRLRVRQRLDAISRAPGVASVLLGETSAVDLSARLGRSVGQVFGLIAETRRKAMKDSELYALMQDKKGVFWARK